MTRRSGARAQQVRRPPDSDPRRALELQIPRVDETPRAFRDAAAGLARDDLHRGHRPQPRRLVRPPAAVHAFPDAGGLRCHGAHRAHARRGRHLRGIAAGQRGLPFLPQGRDRRGSARGAVDVDGAAGRLVRRVQRRRVHHRADTLTDRPRLRPLRDADSHCRGDTRDPVPRDGPPRAPATPGAVAAVHVDQHRPAGPAAHAQRDLRRRHATRREGHPPQHADHQLRPGAGPRHPVRRPRGTARVDAVDAGPCCDTACR
jgi:hypothetical protein